MNGAVKKRVLVLGASGNIMPFVIEGLEPYYQLKLTDLAPHPDGRETEQVDVTSYQQVRDAAAGMDAIMNYTVVRDDPDLSFSVNTRGAWNVMKAAAELGIKKVLHSGPQFIRCAYDHDFNIVDVPRYTGTGYYVITKMLASEICRVYARVHEIQTISFLFNGLGPKPTERGPRDCPPFTVIWEDLQLACRLALEIESVPGNFQEFNLNSYLGHGKYSIEKAQRILGFEPTEDWDSYFERTP